MVRMARRVLIDAACGFGDPIREVRGPFLPIDNAGWAGKAHAIIFFAMRVWHRRSNDRRGRISERIFQCLPLADLSWSSSWLSSY
jgi:hypothetical protein